MTANEAIEIIYSCNDDNWREITRPVMQFVMNSLQSGNKEELDNLLTLDVSKTRLHMASTLLRITYAYSSKLNNWFIFRNKLIDHCNAINEPKWKHSLRGLLNDNPHSTPYGKDMDKLLNIHPTFCR